MECTFLGLIFLLNALSVKSYGESEYWFSLIKVVTIIVFIGVGLLTIFGILGGQFIGFKNFTLGDAPVHGGLLSILSIFSSQVFLSKERNLSGLLQEKVKSRRKTYQRRFDKYSGVFFCSILSPLLSLALLFLIQVLICWEGMSIVSLSVLLPLYLRKWALHLRHP